MTIIVLYLTCVVGCVVVASEKNTAHGGLKANEVGSMILALLKRTRKATFGTFASNTPVI